MLNSLLPLLVSVHNLTPCLETILAQANFETIGLVHLNKTSDLVDNIHQQLIRNTNHAWMRFNMDDTLGLKHRMLKDNNFKNIFLVYFLDEYVDWMYVFRFIRLSKLDYRSNHIYIVNEYPTFEDISDMGRYISSYKTFYNSVTMFWNATGDGSGLEMYTFSFLGDSIVTRIPITNDQCDDDIYTKMFPNKLLNFHGTGIKVFAQSEPPRIVKTAAMVNGRREYNVGGHDVLIAEVVCKHLNARMQFKLMMMLVFLTGPFQYEATMSK